MRLTSDMLETSRDFVLCRVVAAAVTFAVTRQRSSISQTILSEILYMPCIQ